VAGCHSICGERRLTMRPAVADRCQACQHLIAEVARRGGWSAVTEIRRGDAGSDIETILVRPARGLLRPPELAVVRV
jgi:hypothetical protein